MFENTQEPVDEATMLADVRGLPIGDLLAEEAEDLDDTLRWVLRGLTPMGEQYAAFGSAP